MNNYPTEKAPSNNEDRNRNRLLQNSFFQHVKKEYETYESRMYRKTTDFIKSWAFDSVKRHFGFDIIIKSPDNYDPESYSGLIEWIKKYDKHFDRHTQMRNGFVGLSDCQFIMNVDVSTYAFIASGKNYIQMRSEAEFFTDDKVSRNEIYIYIFGKKSYRHYQYINKLFDNKKKEGELYHLKVTQGSDGENFRISSNILKPRTMDTIYLENKVTDKIKMHIDNFIQNKSIYDSRNLRYKTGILLQGEPGTGKTSLATAIATEYKSDLIVIDMNSFEGINTTVLSETINADDCQYIVLLEDIDCIIGDREDEKADKEDKALINKLLQFLDSSSSPTNVIFIATTNHPEKLDAAIKRDGRFDLVVEVRGIYKEKTIEMCRSFDISNEALREILDEIGENYPVNQSWLQNRILKTFETHIDIVAE